MKLTSGIQLGSMTEMGIEWEINFLFIPGYVYWDRIDRNGKSNDTFILWRQLSDNSWFSTMLPSVPQTAVGLLNIYKLPTHVLVHVLFPCDGHEDDSYGEDNYWKTQIQYPTDVN